MSQDRLEDTTNLVEEYRQKFGSHPIRIERFRITQRGRITRESKKLIQDGQYNEEEAQFYTLIHEFLVAEDLYPAPVEVFIEDFLTIATGMGYPVGSTAQEEVIEYVVTPYIKSLQFLKDVFFDLSRWSIQRVSQGWDIELCKAYALNDFLKPLMVTLVENFPNVELHFLAALAWATFVRYIKKREIKEGELDVRDITIKAFYKTVNLEYPEELTGSVYCFDVAYKFLLNKNWDDFMAMIEPEVKKLHEQFERDKEIMRIEQNARKASEARAADPIAESKNRVGMKIFELFGFNQELTLDKEQAIEKAFSLMVRRMALQIFGHVSAEDPGPIREKVAEFLWPEIKEHPEIIAFGIVGAKTKFYEPGRKDPDFLMEDFKANPSEMDQYQEKFLERLFSGYTGGAEYEKIARNFIDILRQAKDTERKR